MTEMMHAKAFGPFEELAAKLLPFAFEHETDGSHDFTHLLRVWRHACTMQDTEGGDLEVLCAATLLHDCVSVEKNSPQRSHASRLAAEKASTLLRQLNWPEKRVDAVAYAIEAHSFSANVEPQTIEAKILQDADRLDAIGIIGAARCFYIAGRMGTALYDWCDPMAEDRALDDKRFAMDHFRTKLFGLVDGFQTQTGREMAQKRHLKLNGLLVDVFEETDS